MNTVRQVLGFLMMILAVIVVCLMFWQSYEDVSKIKDEIAKLNKTIQWSIILFIFIPVCGAFMLFGYYCMKGEYNDQPKS